MKRGGDETAGESPPRPSLRGSGRGEAALYPWVPAAVFVALTLWLFRAFIFSDQMLVGGDTLSLGYVARAFFARFLGESGSIPAWNPQILGGTPFLEALSGGDALYPPSLLLLLVADPYRALGWKLVVHILAAGFFMFGWIRALGLSRPAALVAGVGFMLAPFLVSLVHPGHDGKIFVTALAPLLFWAVERHFVAPRAQTFAGIGLVVALVTFTTHFQMAYFLFGSVGLYAFFRAYQVWKREPAEADGVDAERPHHLRPAASRFGLFLAASVMGAAGAGVQLLPAADYVTTYSRRIATTREASGESGRAWSSSWSIHQEEAMSQLIPEFSGNNAGGPAWTQNTYWGRNIFKDNHEAAGLLLLLLAAVSFAGAARPEVRGFFTGLGIMAFCFALGSHTPVWGSFFAVVPGIRLFRAPSQVMFLFGFAVATLAAFGVDRILRASAEDDDKGWARINSVLRGGVAVLGVLLVLAATGALTSLWTSFVYPRIDPARLATLEMLKPFLVRGAFVSAALAAATWGLVWAVRKRVATPTVLVAGLTVLVAADQLRVSSAFVQVMDFHEWARPDANMQAVLDRQAGDPEPYRLLSFVQNGQDVRPALHGIELAAGHHPNDLARYRELIGMVGSGRPDNLGNANIRQILNVRYILWPDWQLGPAPSTAAVSRTQLGDGRAYETLLADAGLPRARLVGSAVVKSDENAVPYMLSSQHNPTLEVVLAEEPPVALGGGAVNGAVEWVEREPGRLILSVESDRPALLVVSDNWFPAWRATVDGEETPILRAYHTLRAVPVQPGRHTVEMVYRSDIVSRSLWLTIIALSGLALLGLYGLVTGRRRAA